MINMIEKFFEKYYDKEKYAFNFHKMEKILTVSGVNGNNTCEHNCHALTHVGDMVGNETRERWAVKKISTAIAYQKGDETAVHGSYEPSWFEDELTLSDYLEYFLHKDSPELNKLIRWVKDRDINFYSYSDRRLVINLELKEVTGLAICAHTDYSKRFKCHGIRFIFEYTASHNDGEFALYNAYPILTKEDRAIVKKNYKKK